MTQILARTSEGEVRGLVKDGVAVFRGVPFADTTAGANRFMPPRPAPKRRDTLDCSGRAPICPQAPARLAQVMGPIDEQQSEDCLSLTIWAPTGFDRRRPVLVWFHGGGYASGAGGLDWYAGDRLAREQDIVVVGVNYRVGALGYLRAADIVDGNMGLLDQVAAVRWVSANAHAFGADPDQITLAGQSGGGHSILCMLAMTDTRTLVRRMILFSAPFGMRPLSEADTTAAAGHFLGALGIDKSQPGTLEKLQSAPLSAILGAQQATAQALVRAAADPTPPFGPAATAQLPGGREFDRIVARTAVDAMISVTADEMAPFYKGDPRVAALTIDDLAQRGEALFGASSETRLAAVRQQHPEASPTDLLCRAQNTHYFVDGALGLAEAIAANGGRTWVCQMDVRAAAPPLGACHCVELPYVFGSLSAFAGTPLLGAPDAAKEALSTRMRAAIGNFIRAGDPACADAWAWPRFEPNHRTVLHVDQDAKIGNRTAKDCAAWLAAG